MKLIPKLLTFVLIALLSIQSRAAIGSQSTDQAYVTLLYGDEFLLGVRVLGKSIRDTGSNKDMVVLVSDGVSDYSKKLLKVTSTYKNLVFFAFCRELNWKFNLIPFLYGIGLEVWLFKFVKKVTANKESYWVHSLVYWNSFGCFSFFFLIFLLFLSFIILLIEFLDSGNLVFFYPHLKVLLGFSWCFVMSDSIECLCKAFGRLKVETFVMRNISICFYTLCFLFFLIFLVAENCAGRWVDSGEDKLIGKSKSSASKEVLGCLHQAEDFQYD